VHPLLRLFARPLFLLSMATLVSVGLPAQTGLKRPQIVVPAQSVTARDAGRCSDPSQPCFQNNKDILGGQHTLLKIQDIFVQGFFGSNVSSSTSCLTSNGQCTKGNPESTFPGLFSPAYGTANQAVRFDQSGTMQVVTGTLGQQPLKNLGLALRTNGQPGGGSEVEYFQQDGAHQIYGQYNLYSAAADLNGDGLDEVVFAGQQSLLVNDHNLNPGNSYTIGHDVVGVAAGYINGMQQIAVMWSLGTELHVSLFTIDSNLNLIAGPTAKVSDGPDPGNAGASLFSASMTSGYFSRLDSLQLVAEYVDQKHNLSVVSIDFDGQSNPVGKSVTAVGSNRYYGKLVAGHFLSTPYDQVVALLKDQTNAGFGLTYYQFNPTDFSLTGDHPYYQHDGCGYDLATGSFDRQVPASGSSPATINPLDQLVVAKADACGGNGFETAIYTVSSNANDAFQLTNTHSFPVPYLNNQPQTYIDSLSLAAVDLQDRSLVLGAPSVVTLNNHTQPSVIIGAPPMHVDFIDPGNNKPQVINFSAAPDGFSSQFQSENSSGTGQETQSSNTWSFSSTETTKDSVGFGDCEFGDCANATVKASATQAVNGTKSSTGTSYGQNSQSFQSLTGFGDELITRSSTVTTYIYPVLGHFVCPSNLPNCTPAQQVQENVQIAGQDSINTLPLDGTGVPWYQPVWMSGNVLSYPGTVGQLQYDQNLDSTFQEVGNVISGLKTDAGGTSSVAVNWANSSSNQQSSGLSANFSFDASLSVTAKAQLEVVNVSTKNTLDLAGSYGFSNLLTSTTSLAASRGLQINRTARFSDPNAYSYVLIPHIYGQTQPPGVVDSSGLNTDVQTFGALRMGYVAQPLASDGSTGYVWTNWYGRALDVGLNQPAKWQIVPATNGPSGDPACLVPNIGSSDEDCAVLGNNSPQEPDADEFRYLRGFFIQATNASGANGPQLEQAQDGSTLQLGLRVYNFSAVPLPQGATVHARFFAMPSANVEPPNSGNSIFLGEETTGTLPAFSDTTDTPNWKLLTHTLQLASYPQFSDKYLYFWVFVWAQDASGKLIQDLPYHGITNLPPAASPGSSALYSNYARLEQAYGNNMGLYHAPLYIANPSQVADGNATTSVEITKSGARHERVRQGRPDKISVVLHTGNGAVANSVTVLFYDGDPENTARPFAYRLLPYLKADSNTRLQAYFRSGVVGKHRIYVVLGPGTNLKHEVIADTVEVVDQHAHEDDLADE
jgi:hypothetical protein